MGKSKDRQHEGQKEKDKRTVRHDNYWCNLPYLHIVNNDVFVDNKTITKGQTTTYKAKHTHKTTRESHIRFVIVVKEKKYQSETIIYTLLLYH
jgi:hypothetical protein